MGDWEDTVRELARGTSYPPTPDFSTRARERAPARAGAWLRWAAAAALAALALGGGLLVAPSTRAAALRSLRIGGAEVAVPGADLLADSVPARPLSDLPGETTLEEARAALGLALPLPPELGPPDRVFVQADDKIALVAWTAAGDREHAALVLHALAPGAAASKTEPEVVARTRVGGREALWISGPHFLRYGASYDFVRFVEGNVLVWADAQGVTYRLESSLPLAEARRLAETMGEQREEHD